MLENTKLCGKKSVSLQANQWKLKESVPIFSRTKCSVLDWGEWRPPMDVSLKTPRFSMETPHFFSLETPYFHWRPYIFIGDPIFSLKTPFFLGAPIFSLETPQILDWDRNIFIMGTTFYLKTPRFSLETPIFSLETPKNFIEDPQIFIGNPTFSLDNPILRGPQWKSQ